MHTSRNIRNAGTISIYLLFCNPVKIYEVWSMKYEVWNQFSELAPRPQHSVQKFLRTECKTSLLSVPLEFFDGNDFSTFFISEAFTCVIANIAFVCVGPRGKFSRAVDMFLFMNVSLRILALSISSKTVLLSFPFSWGTMFDEWMP